MLILSMLILCIIFLSPLHAQAALNKTTEEFHTNIQSKRGIVNRQICSIQTEGNFRDIKENDKFRQFNYRSTEKVYKEFMLYAIDRNMNKYHHFLHDKYINSKGKPWRRPHRKKNTSRICSKGFLRPKIGKNNKGKDISRRRVYAERHGVLLEMLFGETGIKNVISRQPVFKDYLTIDKRGPKPSLKQLSCFVSVITQL